MENEGIPTQGMTNVEGTPTQGIPTQGTTNIEGTPTQGMPSSSESNESNRIGSNDIDSEIGKNVLGKRNGIYRIDQKINSSGEADIYLCTSIMERKNYVLKLYSDRRKIDAEKRKRIIEFLSKEHKHVIKLVDYGEYNKRMFDIYPYYKAGNIRRIDIENRKSFLENIIIPQLNEGLKEIHQENIIHRDIKPENIFITEDLQNVVIGDFGISSIIDEKEDSRMTKSDTRTPGYTAPETYSGLVGNYTDYYSMGIVLLEILIGENIFSGLSSDQIFKATMERKIPRLNEIPSNEERIKGLILGLVMYDYDKRWGDKEIEQWIKGEIQKPISVNEEQNEKNNNFDNFSRPIRLNQTNSKNLKELGIAFTKNWENSKGSLYRGSITPFLESERQLDLAGYIYEIINNTNNYLTFNRTNFDKKDIGLFKTIYLINPEIDKIYWKGKCYNTVEMIVEDIPKDESIGDLLLNGEISWYLKKRKQYIYVSERAITIIEKMEQEMKSYAQKNNYVKAKEILYRLFWLFKNSEVTLQELNKTLDNFIGILERSGNSIYLKLDEIMSNPSFRGMIWKLNQEGIFKSYDEMDKRNKFHNATEQLKILETLTSKKEKVRKLALKYGKKSNITWLKENLVLYYYQDDVELISLKNKIDSIDMDVTKNDIVSLTNNLIKAEYLYDEFSRRNLISTVKILNSEIIKNTSDYQKKIIPLREDAIFYPYYEGNYKVPIGFIKTVEMNPIIKIPKPYKTKDEKLLKSARNNINNSQLQQAQNDLNLIEQKNAEWYYLYSNLSYRRGDYIDAMGKAKIAIRMDPTNQRYNNFLDQIKKEKGRRPKYPKDSGDDCKRCCECCECCGCDEGCGGCCECCCGFVFLEYVRNCYGMVLEL